MAVPKKKESDASKAAKLLVTGGKKKNEDDDDANNQDTLVDIDPEQLRNNPFRGKADPFSQEVQELQQNYFGGTHSGLFPQGRRLSS